MTRRPRMRPFELFAEGTAMVPPRARGALRAVELANAASVMARPGETSARRSQGACTTSGRRTVSGSFPPGIPPGGSIARRSLDGLQATGGLVVPSSPPRPLEVATAAFAGVSAVKFGALPWPKSPPPLLSQLWVGVNGPEGQRGPEQAPCLPFHRATARCSMGAIASRGDEPQASEAGGFLSAREGRTSGSPPPPGRSMPVRESDASALD
jgi:hypothetical protein